MRAQHGFVHLAAGEEGPRAYTGPYPIRTHGTLADHPPYNLRIEQDYDDAAFARQVVQVYRIPPRRLHPEYPPIMRRITIALGLAGGAIVIGGAVYLMALGALVLSAAS